MKAVALLSGGLDSRLAVKILLEQRIDIVSINYLTAFCTCTSKNSCKLEARKAAEEYNIPLKVFNITKEFLEVVKNPKFGYGRGLNPCLDCRILMFKRAKEYMEEIGASFIVTGEVLGERPMSQRRDAMRIIERESGLQGLVVRPLSAQILESTLPEKKGWVDRRRLLSISGRSRKPQMELANKLGVRDYPCPAGGCLLTDKSFAQRLKRLLEKDGKFSLREINLLKVGRHFYLTSGKTVIIGRNEEENRRLEKLAQPGDLLLKVVEKEGPLTFVKGGQFDEQFLEEAGALTARYSQAREKLSVKVAYWEVGKEEKNILVVKPALGWELTEKLERN